MVCKDGTFVKENNIELISNDMTSSAETWNHKFLNSNFINIIIGKPGAGKTFLIRELIMNSKLYRGFFNKVYFFSPSDIEGI